MALDGGPYYTCGYTDSDLGEAWSQLESMASDGRRQWVQADPGNAGNTLRLIYCFAAGCHCKPSYCELQSNAFLALARNTGRRSGSVAVQVVPGNNALSLAQSCRKTIWLAPATGKWFDHGALLGRAASLAGDVDAVLGLDAQVGVTVVLHIYALRDTTKDQHVIRELADDRDISQNAQVSEVQLRAVVTE